MLEHLSHWLGKHPIIGPVLSASIPDCDEDLVIFMVLSGANLHWRYDCATACGEATLEAS